MNDDDDNDNDIMIFNVSWSIRFIALYSKRTWGNQKFVIECVLECVHCVKNTLHYCTTIMQLQTENLGTLCFIAYSLYTVDIPSNTY